MITLGLIAVTFMALGYLIAKLPVVDAIIDHIATILVYKTLETTAVDKRATVGQGMKHDRTEKELIN